MTHIPQADLFAKLRNVKLRGFDSFPIYKDATFEIVTLRPDEIQPTQRYVLQAGVSMVAAIWADALEDGVNIFSLDGGVILKGVPLLPPIVEQENGSIILNDGMHRVYLARELGRTINVVLVSNLPPEYPYYAHPLPNGWADVQEIEELTEGFKRKEYRDPANYKALFRDFNAEFPGVQMQRVTTQEGR